MGPSIEVTFQGEAQMLELSLHQGGDGDKGAEASDQVWDRICALASELSGLGAYALNYEDEEGYPRALTQGTVEDLVWIAEGSFTPVRITVNPVRDDSSLDDLSSLLRRSLDTPPPLAEIAVAAPEAECQSMAPVFAACRRDGVAHTEVTGERTKRDWRSIAAGLAFAAIFGLLHVWRRHVGAVGFDFVFPLCVVCSVTSTLWLLVWSTVKTFESKPVEQSARSFAAVPLSLSSSRRRRSTPAAA
jgi:hypothetical protein